MVSKITKFIGFLLLLLVFVFRRIESANPIKYSLFPANGDAPELLLRNDPNFESKGFDKNLPTRIIVLDPGQEPNNDVTQKLLKYIREEGKSNNIFVSLNSKFLPGKGQLSSLVYEMGYDINRFIQFLYSNHNVVAKDTVLIGHGVGAQIAGVVAKNLYSDRKPRVGVIVALGPSRESTVLRKSTFQLRRNDADVVVVYHTDISKPKRFSLIGSTDIFVINPKGCTNIECNRNVAIDVFTSGDMMTKCEGLPGNGQEDNWCDDSFPAVYVNCVSTYPEGIFKIDVNNPRKKPQITPEITEEVMEDPEDSKGDEGIEEPLVESESADEPEVEEEAIEDDSE